MQFVDEVIIHIESGAGGDGCMSFRRERNIPRGGPNGGDGGKGGDVWAVATADRTTLIDFRYQQHFRGQRGRHGMGSQCHGAHGASVTLEVPIGTEIYSQESGVLLGDLSVAGQKILLAKGGKGGLGNVHFKSSINRSPRHTTSGQPGEAFAVVMQLKLLSDVGIIGLPNAGKSTWLSRVTAATPKIADYPFTTLIPQLGVVSMDHRSFVMADIPGLIEGAHLGRGLGDRFLRHIERCSVLVHVLDISAVNPVEDYQLIRRELQAYSHKLAQKPEYILCNKIDVLMKEERALVVQHLTEALSLPTPPLCVSAATGEGSTQAIRVLMAAVFALRAERAAAQTQDGTRAAPPTDAEGDDGQPPSRSKHGSTF